MRRLNQALVSLDGEDIYSALCLVQDLHEDVVNHAPVFEFFMAAATALSNACDATHITEGLEPIKMLNQEVANRWEVMTNVVAHKKNLVGNVQQQLKQYEDVLEKFQHLLNRAEATLVSQSVAGADLNKAKVNRDTLKVRGCLRFGVKYV